MDSKPRYSLETIQANAPSGVDPWLTPDAVSELTGFDKKWLANAREGRKNIQGPPYVKVGEGRTAPIRYRLSSLIAWMASFNEQLSTVHRVISAHRNFAGFMESATSNERWLFAVSADGSSATDIFEAMKHESMPSSTKLQWLTRDDYTHQRFIKAKLRLDAKTITHLLDIGGGDLSVGVEKLLGKPFN